LPCQGIRQAQCAVSLAGEDPWLLGKPRARSLRCQVPGRGCPQPHRRHNSIVSRRARFAVECRPMRGRRRQERSSVWNGAGTRRPSRIPAAMHNATQTVSNRSNRPRRAREVSCPSVLLRVACSACHRLSLSHGLVTLWSAIADCVRPPSTLIPFIWNPGIIPLPWFRHGRYGFRQYFQNHGSTGGNP
jgi:hypothetical protein